MVKMIYDQADLLPAKMKEIFLMTYQLGMKPSEIAEQLGISVKTVKNQRLNAVNMLKRIITRQTFPANGFNAPKQKDNFLKSPGTFLLLVRIDK